MGVRVFRLSSPHDGLNELATDQVVVGFEASVFGLPAHASSWKELDQAIRDKALLRRVTHEEITSHIHFVRYGKLSKSTF